MKALCREAGVSAGKVFPHNLRHLFARTYYNMKKDIENGGNDGSTVFTLIELMEALNNNSIDVESGIGYFGNNFTISDMRAYTDTEYIESMKPYYNFVHWYPDKND